MDELFSNAPKLVQSSRILYTPTFFARSSLLYLQEIGKLQAIKPHISQRENLASYLFFYVEAGSGELEYANQKYSLNAGDVVFISCLKKYAHQSSDDLWKLRWCHFNGSTMAEIYQKYCERGGQPVFRPSDFSRYSSILKLLYETAESQDYVRDMKINVQLGQLLSYLMEDAWNPEQVTVIQKRYELQEVKKYLDEHFNEKIVMDDLSAQFYISKHYLSKIFHETYGFTIVNYLNQKRITKAKHLLRFSDLSMEEIAAQIGYIDANYFSRMFKKIEGMRPSEFRQKW